MNQQGQEVVKGYVIIRNLSKGSKGFSDHRNSPVMLDAFGQKNDQIKILLEENNMDKAVRHYVTYRQAGMQVTFSEGVNDNFPEFKDHLQVHSTVAVDQSLADRAAYVRNRLAQKNRDDGALSVRLARAKAQGIIDGSKERVALTNTDANPGELKDRLDAAKQSVAAAGTESAVVRQPMGDEEASEEVMEAPIEEEKPGVALNMETLSKKELPELIEIASKLGVKLKEGVAKGAAVKSILLSLNKQG